MKPELLIRASVQDQAALCDTIYAGSSPGVAPLVDRVVIDAENAGRLEQLRQVVQEAGVPLLIDPNTFYWQSDTDAEFSWNQLPYGRAQQIEVARLEEAQIDRLARLTVDFQLSNGASAILAPYLFSENPRDPAFEKSLGLLRATSKYMHQIGIAATMQMIPLLCGQITGLGNESDRETVMRLFGQMSGELGARTVATVLGPCGDGKESAVKLDRLFRLHLDLKSLPTVRTVLALRQGLYGESLVSAGIDGYETGAAGNEQNQLRRMIRDRGPREEDDDSRSGWSVRRVYLDAVQKSLNPKLVMPLLEDRSVGARYVCRDPNCCGHGAKSMRTGRVSHAIRARSRRLAELAQMPQPAWRLRDAELRAARSAKDAETITKYFEKLQVGAARVERVQAKGYQSLEQVCRRLREQDEQRRRAA